MKAIRKGQRGYNIVEVLIAMAILGSVILSIVALFYLGRRNVYSGNKLTFANSVGVQVMEDLTAVDMLALYNAFGITSSTTLVASKTLNGITYTNVVYRTTDDLTQDVIPPTGPGFLTRWKSTIGTGNRLQSPKVELLLMPTLPNTALWTNTTPPKPSPSIMKIRVIISWKEGQRTRAITLDTIKTQRS